MSVHDIFKHEEQCQHIHHGRELPEAAGDDLHRHVGEESEHDALGDACREGHDDDGDEGGQRLGDVAEVEICHGFHHQHAHDDQCAGGGSRRDCQEERRKEQRHGEQQPLTATIPT